MQTNASGVKIYGKKGRRTRAKDRLEKQLEIEQVSLKEYHSKTKFSKGVDLDFHMDNIRLRERDIKRIEKEIETLKSRI